MIFGLCLKNQANDIIFLGLKNFKRIWCNKYNFLREKSIKYQKIKVKKKHLNIKMTENEGYEETIEQLVDNLNQTQQQINKNPWSWADIDIVW